MIKVGGISIFQLSLLSDLQEEKTNWKPYNILWEEYPDPYLCGNVVIILDKLYGCKKDYIHKSAEGYLFRDCGGDKYKSIGNITEQDVINALLEVVASLPITGGRVKLVKELTEVEEH